jgi:hypothetical protein
MPGAQSPFGWPRRAGTRALLVFSRMLHNPRRQGRSHPAVICCCLAFFLALTGVPASANLTASCTRTYGDAKRIPAGLKIDLSSDNTYADIRYLDDKNNEFGGSKLVNGFAYDADKNAPLPNNQIARIRDGVSVDGKTIRWSRSEQLRQSDEDISLEFNYDFDLLSNILVVRAHTVRPRSEPHETILDGVFRCQTSLPAALGDRPNTAVCARQDVNRTARAAFGKMYITPQVMSQWHVTVDDLAEAFLLRDAAEDSVNGQQHLCAGTMNVNWPWFEAKSSNVSDAGIMMPLMLLRFKLNPQGIRTNFTVEPLSSGNFNVSIRNPVTLPDDWVLHCDQCGG